MSQYSRKKAKIIIAVVLLQSILIGCSAERLKAIVTTGDTTHPSYSPTTSPELQIEGERQILEHTENITGGNPSYSGIVGQFTRLLAGTTQEISFGRPIGVSGFGDYLFILDAEGPVVHRYHLAKKTLVPLRHVGSQFVGEPMNIFVEPDLSFYVADPVGKQVLHFDQDGQLIRNFSDIANLSRPVDMMVDTLQDYLLVADGAYSHIVVFDKLGKSLRAIGKRGSGPGRFRTITALASSPTSLYVADRLEIPVQELDLNGAFRFSFGEGHLIWPTAIAIDKDQRVFVSEKLDNTIKVFDNVRLIATIGGTGSAPGRFRLITDMWLSEDDMLYVADSLNKRIQVFRVIPEEETEPNLLTPDFREFQ